MHRKYIVRLTSKERTALETLISLGRGPASSSHYERMT